MQLGINPFQPQLTSRQFILGALRVPGTALRSGAPLRRAILHSHRLT